MAAQWVIEGCQVMMDAVWKTNATPEQKEIFLFSNDVSITDSLVNADLTEITTNGGEKGTLVKASFTAATAADPIVSIYNSGTGFIFNITGSLSVYGFAIRGVTSSKIYMAENFGLKSFVSGDILTADPISFSLDIPE